MTQNSADSDRVPNFISVDQALLDDVLYTVLEQVFVIPQEASVFFRGRFDFLERLQALEALLSSPVVWSDVGVFTRSAGSLHLVELCLSQSPCMQGMDRINQPIKLRYDETGISVLVIIARHRSKIRGLYLRTRRASDYDSVSIGMTNLERL